MRTWKVGELAKRTGLTVRTLHHYERIGLLSPTRRSPTGYRLYDEDDVARLQRIVSLRQLGFSLEDIGMCLDSPAWSLERILRLQIERLRGRLEEERRLVKRLEALASRLARMATESAGPPEQVSADELLETLEATMLFEKYYTPEQMEQLEERRKQLGEDHIRAVEQEWPQLIEKVLDCMRRGVDPTGEEVQPLARRWKELVREFTGGDPGIAQSVSKMYQNEPEVRQRVGLDPGLMSYVGKAMAGIGGW